MKVTLNIQQTIYSISHPILHKTYQILANRFPKFLTQSLVLDLRISFRVNPDIFEGNLNNPTKFGTSKTLFKNINKIHGNMKLTS